MRTGFSWMLSAMLVLMVSTDLRADDPNGPRAVVDKAIQATGGEAKLSKLKAATWKGKGTIAIMGTELEFTGDWAQQAPDQARASVTVDAGGMIFKMVRVVNGDQGWMKQNDNDAQPMPDEFLAEEKRELIAQWALS